MIAFSKAYTHFQKMNTELLGLSIDSNASHLAWMNDIYQRTRIVLPFPIVADRSGEIARLYGMISKDISSTQTVRDVIIIDPESTIRVILTYPLNVGRNIAEIIRTVQALQMADLNKASTPANWIPNQPIIMPPPKTFEELMKRREEIMRNQNGMMWYLSFQNSQRETENNRIEEPKKAIESKENKNKKIQ